MFARLSALVLFVLVLPGCETKTEPIPQAQSQPEPRPAEPKEPATFEVPVSVEDKAHVAAAEKLGAAVYDAHPAGYEIHIDAARDADAILAALKGTKCIVALNVEGTTLTDAGMQPLADFMFLDRITLASCPNVTGDGFAALTSLPRFKELAVVDTPLADLACKHLARLSKLETLRLVRTQISDAGLGELAILPTLELLVLEGTPISGTAFETQGWPRLHRLDATGTRLDDRGLKAVARLPVLTNLLLNSEAVTDEGILRLKDAKKLQELSLAHTKLTDTGLAELAGLDALRMLDISSTAITGGAFERFPIRPELRKLDAAGTRLTDAGAIHLAKFPNLSVLSLADCPVSEKGLAVLKELKSLERCDLSGTQADDAIAAIVGKLPIQEASFARTKMTDTGLRELAAGNAIRYIDVRETKATREGADRARMGRTRLEIRVE